MSRLRAVLKMHDPVRNTDAGFFNQKKGSDGELVAYRYLRQQGYKIVARNYRKRFGEVDLIGWDGESSRSSR